jgi:hypothetical protein
MNILHLTLKKKWFDMILSGEKKEEYREIKKYWSDRFYGVNNYSLVCFTNGYGNHRPSLTIELNDICVGQGNTEWGAPNDQDVFILELGLIISKRNIS